MRITCKHAFTMAEILISLTIIGVIAAITLPALRTNINETTWKTQRRALYLRMSQAVSLMPTLNGYGVGTTQAETNEHAATVFVTNGLSKVFEMNNICDYTKLKDCGIPAKYRKFKSSKTYDFPTTLHEINSYLSNSHNPTKNVNTKAAAFETKNGESIAVFYNPSCMDKDVLSVISNTNGLKYNFIWPYFCASFIYDLNGKKGPNRVGQDIWFMSVLYSDKMETVQFEPERMGPYKSNEQYTFNQVKSYCANINARMAKKEEMMTSMYNTKFTGLSSFGIGKGVSDTERYVFGSNGELLYNYTSNVTNFRCIYNRK